MLVAHGDYSSIASYRIYPRDISRSVWNCSLYLEIRDFHAETQTIFCGLALAPLDWDRGSVMLVPLYIVVNEEYPISLRI